jgi:hypothetical protein
MARLATLGETYSHRPGIAVEVVNGHGREFAVAAAGEQCGCDQHAEIGRAGVHQPARFIV